MSIHALKNCPRCDAPLNGQEASCPACHRPLAAPGGLAGTKMPNCPVCKIPLYAAAMAGQELLHCAECQGSGFKREALMKLRPDDSKEIERSREEKDYKRPPYFEPREKPPFLICPFCGKRMKEQRLGPMGVDLCEKCSALWLDGSKAAHLAALLSPYKWKISSAGGRR